jgi:hypothetical protein
MSTKNKITTNNNPERCLIEGATILMREFKTPAKFLSFLTNALYWTSFEKVSYANGPSRTWFIRLLHNEVLIPWMKGGKDVEKNICKGLDEVAGCGSYDEYYKDIAKIIEGFSLSMLPDIYEADYLCEQLSHIQTMLSVGYCVNLYDQEMKEIKQAKLNSNQSN